MRECASLEEVRAEVTAYGPDVVLTDLKMPPAHRDEAWSSAGATPQQSGDQGCRPDRTSSKPSTPTALLADGNRARHTCSRTGSGTSINSWPRSRRSATWPVGHRPSGRPTNHAPPGPQRDQPGRAPDIRQGAGCSPSSPPAPPNTCRCRNTLSSPSGPWKNTSTRSSPARTADRVCARSAEVSTVLLLSPTVVRAHPGRSQSALRSSPRGDAGRRAPASGRRRQAAFARPPRHWSPVSPAYVCRTAASVIKPGPRWPRPASTSTLLDIRMPGEDALSFRRLGAEGAARVGGGPGVGVWRARRPDLAARRGRRFRREGGPGTGELAGRDRCNKSGTSGRRAR